MMGPLNLQRLPWASRAFMRALVASNPGGLCAFDVFMMHAVAQTPSEQTIEPGFIDYIDREYEALLVQAQETMTDDRFAAILAPLCLRAKT